MKVRAYFKADGPGSPALLAVEPFALSTPGMFELLVATHVDVFYEDYSSVEQLVACLDLKLTAVYNASGFVEHVDEMPEGSFNAVDNESVPNLKDIHQNFTFMHHENRLLYGFPPSNIICRENN